jgi:putative copper resistance protein D
MLFDLFGFLSVVLRGLDLVAQSVLLGSVAFALLVAVPVTRDAQREPRAILAAVRHVIAAAALATFVTVIAGTAVSAAVLVASLNVSWREVVGADFVIAGGIKAVSAATIGLAVSMRPLGAMATRIAIAIAGALVLCAALANSHAAARLGGSGLLILATAAHELGAALWLGGLPCFWLALRHAGTSEVGHRIGTRFSSLAIAGVSLIAFGALVFAIEYLGSIDAVYGTAYGAMATTKSVMFAMLLCLGCANFYALRRSTANAEAIRRVRRFAEIEMGVGFAVLMAAAWRRLSSPAAARRHPATPMTLHGPSTTIIGPACW